MRFEHGFWIMTSKEYESWMQDFNHIMENPNSGDELIAMAVQFNNQIAIED